MSSFTSSAKAGRPLSWGLTMAFAMKRSATSCCRQVMLMLSDNSGHKIATRLRRGGTFVLLLTLTPGLALANDATLAATSTASGTATGAAVATKPGETLLLGVQVNGHSIGKIGEFTLRHGQLLARAGELRDLGFRVPDSLVSGPNDLIPLGDLPGFTWSLNQKTQELLVTVSDSRLLPTILQPYGRERPEGRRVIESGTGVTLNYDTVDTFVNGQTRATGSLDLRAFSPWGCELGMARVYRHRLDWLRQKHVHTPRFDLHVCRCQYAATL